MYVKGTFPDMNLAEYLDSRGRGAQRELARAIGTTEAHMSRLANGRAKPSAELAAKIEAATDNQVTFKSLMLGAELRSDLKGSGDAGLARAREAVVLDRAGRVRGEAGEGAARQEKGAERVAALAGESGR